MDVMLEHLLLHFRPLHRALGAAVERRAAASASTMANNVSEACVTHEDVRLLIRHLDVQLRDAVEPSEAEHLDEVERALEGLLRLRARDRGVTLPLDALAPLGLDDDERLALLACAAVELDGSYELLYGFVVDDLTRRFASVELLCAVVGNDLRSCLSLRRKLGPAGTLRRMGLLRSDEDGPSERHHVLRVTPRALDFLRFGRGEAVALFSDPAEVELLTAPPIGVDGELCATIAMQLGAGVDTLAVWGPPTSARAEVPMALARSRGVPLRRLRGEPSEALEVAWQLGALLWVDTDSLTDAQRDALLGAAAASPVWLCITGTVPWRPGALLVARRYVELRLDDLGVDDRAALWRRTMPEIDPLQADALAAKLRVAPEKVTIAAALARTTAAIHSNGVVHAASDHLAPALAAVTRATSHAFTTLIEPARRPAELILPPNVHRAVMDVANFARAQATVGESWQMNRLVTGRGGIKALFTGEPGTGKTFAAEVVATELELPLLRVDLAKIVSKWVGETERNLEAAFAEAEASQAILFFDEADSLFGKRGQVQKGSDRYANLEVSYLLQRLEDYGGVAILATNLRDNIDSAFTRRFQVLVHFPRPGREERAAIWQNAFASAPLGADVDVAALAGLDMTGAAIVASARTAALVAAGLGGDVMMRHLVRAVAGQFQQEARILTPRDLGRYGALLEANA
jgi:hypothetical protein